MFLERQDLQDQFAKLFVVTEEGYFFKRRRQEFLLPITEEEYYGAMDAFRVHSIIAMAITWVVIFGAAGKWYYDVLANQVSSTTYLILAGALGYIFLKHVWVGLHVTRPFDLRVQAILKEQAAHEAN